MEINSIKKTITDYYVTPKVRGPIDAGELKNALSFLSLFKKKGFALTDVSLPTANGKTTKIDLIYITQKGIFLANAINQFGMIKGDDTSKNWTSSIYFGEGSSLKNPEKRYTFSNPVLQNDCDVSSLRNFLGDGYDIYSFVVFPNDAEFQDIKLTGIKCCICHMQNFTGHIKRIWTVKKDTILYSDCQELYSRMLSLSDQSDVRKGE